MMRIEIPLTMVEKTVLRKIGNSAGIILESGVLKAYNLKVGDELEIIFNYPEIILRKSKKTDDDA